MEYNVEVSLKNNDEFSNFLQKNIKEFNNKHSFYHREKRKENGVKPINIIVSDRDNNWVGGLNANVYWGWIEINDFWLKDEYRGKGLGSILINKAEKIAKENGAKKALLYTFEFQARTFYEQNGYKVVGEIEDFPPGSSYYIMVKILI